MRTPRKRGAAPRERTVEPAARSLAPGTRRLLAMLALCAIALLAYSNSFSSGFVFDNRGLLLQDPRIREATGQNLGLILQHTYWWPYGESGLYRPFTTLTYLLNYAILGNGEQPAGYHWINFLLHAGNVLLVYALALRLMRDFWPAVFTAALWAVHPVLTESVTNIVGRADLLAGMTLLGGFLIYLKSAEAQGARRWAWLVALTAVTTLGVFSKESAAAILGVIALYEFTWWKERKQGRALLLGCIAILLALELMSYQRAAVFIKVPPAVFPFWDNPLTGASFWTAKLTALKIIARYVGLLVWPVRLSADHSYAQIPLASGSPLDWLAWTVVATLAAVAVLMFRRNRTVFFFAGMAFLTFLPTSNLLFPIGAIMAERFLYLPAIALAACAVATVYAISQRIGLTKLAPAVLCLMVAAFAARTLARNWDWQDDLSLATATVAASPGSYKSHMLLAAALYGSGADSATLDRVITEAEKGLAILEPLPDSRKPPDPYRRAGGYYLTKGDVLSERGPDGSLTATPQSLRAHRRSLELLLRCRSVADATNEQQVAGARASGRVVPQPDNARIADLERAIASVCLRLRDPRMAYEAAVRAQQLDPFDPRSYQQLSNSLLAGDRSDEAAIVLMQGVLLTRDINLRLALTGLYRHGLDTKGCATLPGGATGPALNPACELVRNHLCAAAAQTIRLHLQVRRRDLADDLKATALRDFACPPGPLNQLLP